jgi:hypothetical protein
MMGRCDVCGQWKEVTYCSFCHANLCATCKTNYPARVRAAIRRRF